MNAKAASEGLGENKPCHVSGGVNVNSVMQETGMPNIATSVIMRCRSTID